MYQITCSFLCSHKNALYYFFSHMQSNSWNSSLELVKVVELPFNYGLMWFLADQRRSERLLYTHCTHTVHTLYTHCTTLSVHTHYFILFISWDQGCQISLIWPDQMFQVQKPPIFKNKWVNYDMNHCFVVFLWGKMIFKHAGQLIIVFISSEWGQQRDTEKMIKEL